MSDSCLVRLRRSRRRGLVHISWTIILLGDGTAVVGGAVLQCRRRQLLFVSAGAAAVVSPALRGRSRCIGGMQILSLPGTEVLRFDGFSPTSRVQVLLLPRSTSPPNLPFFFVISFVCHPLPLELAAFATTSTPAPVLDPSTWVGVGGSSSLIFSECMETVTRSSRIGFP